MIWIKFLALASATVLCIIIAWSIDTFFNKTFPLIWSGVALLIGVFIGKLLF